MPLHRRIFGAAAVIGAVFICVALVRVIYLNLNRGEIYAARAFGNANKEIILPAPRGDILDRFGRPLVRNESVWSVAVNANVFIKQSPEEQSALIGELEKILDPTEGDSGVAEILSGADLENGAAIVLERGIDTERVIALKALGDPAIIIQDDYRRSYIYGAQRHTFWVIRAWHRLAGKLKAKAGWRTLRQHAPRTRRKIHRRAGCARCQTFQSL